MKEKICGLWGISSRPFQENINQNYYWCRNCSHKHNFPKLNRWRNLLLQKIHSLIVLWHGCLNSTKFSRLIIWIGNQKIKYVSVLTTYILKYIFKNVWTRACLAKVWHTEMVTTHDINCKLYSSLKFIFIWQDWMRFDLKSILNGMEFPQDIGSMRIWGTNQISNVCPITEKIEKKIILSNKMLNIVWIIKLHTDSGRVVVVNLAITAIGFHNWLVHLDFQTSFSVPASILHQHEVARA